MAGAYALLGAYVAYRILHHDQLTSHGQVARYLMADAVVVLLLAISTGVLLTTRRARAQGATIWDASARRLLINLLIPLVVGGLFSLIMLSHGLVSVIAPSMLIFYGLALVNASKYTLSDIRYLGFAEIVLGLLAALITGYSLLFWTLGFGVLHIIYGTLMYYTHER